MRPRRQPMVQNAYGKLIKKKHEDQLKRVLETPDDRNLPWVRTGNCPIGRGVFCSAPIISGEPVLEYKA